jgi:hypothetical protein
MAKSTKCIIAREIGQDGYPTWVARHRGEIISESRNREAVERAAYQFSTKNSKRGRDGGKRLDDWS